MHNLHTKGRKMKKQLERVCAIAALILMVIVCMTSCKEGVRLDEVSLDKTKGSAATNVSDSAKVETPNEPEKDDKPFIWPIAGFDKSFIEIGFGFHIDPVFGMKQFHQGVDIKANLGDKVLASADGKVVMAQWYGGYGQCVVIEHKDEVKTLYGHLDEMLVKKDADVKKGDTIGLAGSTGNSIKPHVHFEVKTMDKNEEYQAVDPVEFLKDLISINKNSKSLLESGNKIFDYKFNWPIEDQKKLKIETEFGYKVDPIEGFFNFHTGVDIKANLGDKVLASADGKVVKAEWYGGYGNRVIVEHKDGIQTLYGHLSKILVKKDADVKKGDTIGLAGSTGVSTGPHIHFEVKTMEKNGEYKTVDPEEFIREQIKR